MVPAGAGARHRSDYFFEGLDDSTVPGGDTGAAAAMASIRLRRDAGVSSPLDAADAGGFLAPLPDVGVLPDAGFSLTTTISFSDTACRGRGREGKGMTSEHRAEGGERQSTQQNKNKLNY
jgi:hypothetical protein